MLFQKLISFFIFMGLMGQPHISWARSISIQYQSPSGTFNLPGRQDNGKIWLDFFTLARYVYSKKAIKRRNVYVFDFNAFIIAINPHAEFELNQPGRAYRPDHPDGRFHGPPVRARVDELSGSARTLRRCISIDGDRPEARRNIGDPRSPGSRANIARARWRVHTRKTYGTARRP